MSEKDVEMEKGLREEWKDDPSPLPSIQDQEKLLKQMLQEAQARAEEMVRDAEREAAERVREAREEQPARIERGRQEAIRRLEAELGAEADAPRPGGGGDAGQPDEARLREAVEAVVAAVWPGESR